MIIDPLLATSVSIFSILFSIHLSGSGKENLFNNQNFSG